MIFSKKEFYCFEENIILLFFKKISNNNSKYNAVIFYIYIEWYLSLLNFEMQMIDASNSTFLVSQISRFFNIVDFASR